VKSIFTLLFLATAALTAQAQTPEKALARISYSFSHVQDTTQQDRPYKENMVLLIGKNASHYLSYDRVNQIIEGRKEQERMKSNPNAMRTIRGYSPTSTIDYFYFSKEQKLFAKERLINDYIVEEEPTKIAWKITKDTANFSGISCKKATAFFKGRTWNAWFAPDMPFQSGPWKLNGLPGLIIEASDKTGTIKFTFEGMEKVENLSDTDNLTAYLGNEIKFPKAALRSSRKELDKLKEANDNDPQGFAKTQMGGSSVTVVTGALLPGSGGGSPASRPRIVLNNPIELPIKSNK
jgi:GLPGLI family protein